MQTVAYKIIPDPLKNSISFSKNYRIFSTGEPLEKGVQVVDIVEDIELGSADPGNIIRKLRYSTDRGNWSLWYEFSPGNLGDITALEFGESMVFFEVKYEYDDMTYNALATPLLVNEVKIRVTSTQPQADLFTPTVYCTDERCPTLVADREATFKPTD